MISDYSPLMLISKYRNAVMGLAIIGVMLGHWFAISQTPADNIFLKAISIIRNIEYPTNETCGEYRGIL